MFDKDLKNCPLCNDVVCEIHELENTRFQIKCDNCKMETAIYCSEIVLKNDWNNRLMEKNLSEEIDYLKKLLNECRHRFKSYEMDVDMNRPDHHIDFMKRIEAALGV